MGVWACWCFQDGFHERTLIACYKCGRLQPPRQPTAILTCPPDKRLLPIHEDRNDNCGGCIPDPETIKVNY